MSDSRKVVLQSVNWQTSGVYKCEVSGEAPTFVSAESEARMEVVCKYFFITQFGNVALTQLVGVRRSVVFLHNLLDYDGDFIYMKVIWQRCYIQKCSSKANYLFNRLASI